MDKNNKKVIINIQPTSKEINKIMLEELNKPKPTFVAFATYDGPSLIKTMYR